MSRLESVLMYGMMGRLNGGIGDMNIVGELEA